MLGPDVTWYLAVAAFLFSIGAIGVLLRRNPIIVAVGEKASGRLSNAKHIERGFGSPAQVGRLFLTDHLLAFEITSIVLLVAAIGGVILGAHSRKEESGVHA